MEIPETLLDAVREKRCVLFLGAGASAGSQNDVGDNIPLANDLARILDNQFLKGELEGEPFRIVYDYACSARDVRAVQEFVQKTLLPFKPAAHHLLIPKFSCAGLVSTNYDLVIERAYEISSRSAAQKLNVWRSDKGKTSDTIDINSVVYNKIHGCLTEFDKLDPPMIASTEQLIAFKHGREGQFATFMEWAKTKTIVFAGYRFGDENLRTIFQEVIKEGDGRPRHYLVLKDPPEPAISYWADRRVTVISSAFSDFMLGLDSSLSTNEQKLARLEVSHRRTPLTRFIRLPDIRESEALVGYLATHIDIVHPGLDAPRADTKAFYKGYNQAWSPIISNLDVPRAITDQIFSDHVITGGNQPIRFAVLKGHAGSGKTIALRRLAWRAAEDSTRLVFYASRTHKLNYERFIEIIDLTGDDVYLFIDNIADHIDDVVAMIGLFKNRKRKIVITAAESFNVWHHACGDLEAHLTNTYEMRYLSTKEIGALLEKLQAGNSLGHLETLHYNERVEALTKTYGRQLLVTLIEATAGRPLEDILNDEYKSIYPPEARLLYLDICALHRFGPPVRAGLISRLHNISFDDFKDKMFEPLSHIVRLRQDSKSSDFVYEARHAFIANVVYERALDSSEARFENMSRILTKLNPSFSYDTEVAAQLLKADTLLKSIANPARVRQLFDIAEANFGATVFVLHQRAIFEMHQANSVPGLAKAENILRDAIEVEPYSRSLKHTLAEIDLKRARVSGNEVERAAWRSRAISQAANLTTGALMPHAFHTILKAKLDELRDILSSSPETDDEDKTSRLGEAINGFENTLRTGLQKFPNDPLLLGEEGQFFQLLENQPRAERAFQKAFEENVRSTIAAKRLVKLLRARKAFEEAESILRKALESNPSDKTIHFELGTVIRDSAPDADQVRSDEMLFHLRRSFTSKGSDFYAQFWYARQLIIAGNVSDAIDIYESLSEAKIPFSEKTKIRGVIRNSDGRPKRFRGAVVTEKPTYLFFANDEPSCRVYCHKEGNHIAVDSHLIGTLATYDLGFSLRGPCAVNVELIS